MLCRFTDGPRDRRIVGQKLVGIHAESATNGWIPKVQDPPQLNSDRRQVPRPHALGPQPCERELAIEFSIDRRDIGCRVERREAVGRVPAATQATRSFSAEGSVGRGIVSKYEARVRRTIEAVERFKEPAGFRLGYAKTPSPKPSIRARTRRYSPERTRSTGRS